VRTRVLKTLAVAFVVAAAVFGHAHGASAQAGANTAEGDREDASIAGIVGMGFLGLDIGVLLPPMFNLHDQKWAYAVFPIALTGAGVALGVVFSEDLDKAVNTSFLAAGMGLFIPALVGSLAWKSSKEEASYEQQALLKMGPVSLHSPSISAAPTYSAAERVRWGAPQVSSYRLSVFSGTF
jgi:hypothetical protein